MKKFDPVLRLAVASILLQSSVAPAFCQTVAAPVRTVPIAGVTAVPAAIGSQLSGSMRLGGGFGRNGLATPALPSATPGAALNAPSVLASPSAALPALPSAPDLGAVPGLASLPALAEPAALPGAASPAAPSLKEAPGALPSGDLKSKLAPGIELSDYSAEKLGRASEAGSREAGQKLSDAITRTRSVPSRGDAAASFLGAPEETAPAAPAAYQKGKLDPATRPYSPWRLSTFLQDPEKYALLFIFGADDKLTRSDQGYELLVGIAVHEAFEGVFKRIQAGTPGKDIKLDEVLAVYEKLFDEGHKTGQYAERNGWKAAEYKRRGVEYIKAQFERLAPFESQGRVLAIEERVFWKITDPQTGKSYDFKGRIDRLMVKGDTIYIRDWKTHFTPPARTQLERDDFQLGLYALGLARARPDLVKGRRIVLAWDFKEFTQEIAVDEAYLAGIEARVLEILRRIEAFTRRVEAEKPEWLKRLNPDANPAGLKRAKAAVAELGAVLTGMEAKSKELRSLRRQVKVMEEGLTRYAVRTGREEVKGKKYAMTVSASVDPKAVPTKTDDPEGYEAVRKILQDAGVWERYSGLDAAALRRAAEALGGDDHKVFEAFKGLVKSAHQSEVEIYDKGSAAETGGVAAPKLVRRPWAQDAEAGVLSATQLDVFLRDEAEFARRYVLRMREDLDAKPMGTLAGSVIHETLEQLFIWVKGGREIADIHYNDVMKFFDQRWEALRAEAVYEPDSGLTEADYKSGSKAYVKAKWDKLYPFNQGRVIFLEKRLFFTVTDPRTGRTYKFQGIPDRVMLEGDTVVIHDWKSHYTPPSDAEVKAKDYQLGLYILALRQLYPDLMKGRKARLVWDFKDKEVVIEADDAYLKGLEQRLFAVLRRMDDFKAKVNDEFEKWEEAQGAVEVPKTKKAAAEAVDRMGRVAEKIDALEESLKPLKERAAALETEIADFSRKTGLAKVQGGAYESKLVKKSQVSVPTKGREREAYDKVASILKDAGVWEKYSAMDYPALKKALADPNSPDKAVLKRIEPYLKSVGSTRVKVEKVLKKERPKKKPVSGRERAEKDA